MSGPLRHVARSLWTACLLLVGGVAASVLTDYFGPRHYATITESTVTGGTGNPATEHVLDNWAEGIFIAGIFIAVLGLVLVFGWRERNTWSDKDRRMQRIGRLSDSLKQALGDIESIKREVEEGTALLTQLETERATKEELASLTNEQTAAVREFFQGAVRKETNRGTGYAVVIALLFFIAGIAATKPGSTVASR